DRVAPGSAECGEEKGARIPIGDLDGVRPARQAGKLVPGFRDLGQAVQEHLGAKPANRSAGEITVVQGIRVIGPSGQLISSRSTNVADEAFEIVLVLRELRAQGI